MNSSAAITEVGILEANRRTAALGNDIECLEKLFDDRLIYVHSSGVADTKTSYLAALRTGALAYRKISVGQEYFIEHGDTVLLFSHLSIDLVLFGVEKCVDTSTLFVWVRQSAGWMLVGVQSSNALILPGDVLAEV